MKPTDFIERWYKDAESEPLLRFPVESLADVRLPELSRQFLLEAGLPSSAAPFLSFEVSEGALPTVSDTWHLPKEFLCYRMIGFNGSGDPICLDENAAGEVCDLNHDNEFERVLMNSSVVQLAESLLVIRNFVRDGMSAEAEVRCVRELTKIDGAAWDQSGFWRNEMVMIKS